MNTNKSNADVVLFKITSITYVSTLLRCGLEWIITFADIAPPPAGSTPETPRDYTERLIAVEIAPEKCSTNSAQVGAIVGGVLGGIALILIILALLFILYRRGCFSALLTPSVKKSPPVASVYDNEYDNLEEIRKAQGGAFDNKLYNTPGSGHVIGGKGKGKAAGSNPSEGHYDTPNDDGLYDNTRDGHYDNPGFKGDEAKAAAENVYDNV